MKQLVHALLITSFFFISNAMAAAGGASEVAAASAPVATAAVKQLSGSSSSSAYWVTSIVLIAFLFAALVTIKKSLRDGWRLHEALSEEADLPQGTNINTPVMVASSSRLIAFMGSLALIAMFVGFGLCLLWAGFNDKEINTQWAQSFSDYFKLGALLFLPYGANQIQAAMKK